MYIIEIRNDLKENYIYKKILNYEYTRDRNRSFINPDCLKDKEIYNAILSEFKILAKYKNDALEHFNIFKYCAFSLTSFTMYLKKKDLRDLIFNYNYIPCFIDAIKKAKITVEEFNSLNSSMKNSYQFKHYALIYFSIENITKIKMNCIPQLLIERKLNKKQLIALLDSNEFKKKNIIP